MSDIRWYALNVKPRHEQAVAQCLQHKNIESYAPSILVRRKWSDRTKHMKVPLFPGYVFCQCYFDNRLSVLNTPGVNSFVSFGGSPAAVANEEITGIRAAVASGYPVQPGPFVRVGEEVSIVDGPLAGIAGILVREKDSARVVLNIELLQRSIYVEVDREMIAAAPSPMAAGVPARLIETVHAAGGACYRRVEPAHT